MANKINIKGLGKAQLLAALYNNAKLLIPSAAKPGIMTEEDAQKIIDERNNTKIDYVYGRIMKIDISGDEIDPWGYDRDNGEDTVAQIVKQLRDGKHIPPQEKKNTTDNFIDNFFSEKKGQIILKGKEYRVVTLFPDGLDIWFSTLGFKAQIVKSEEKPGMDGYEFAEPPNIFRLIIGEGEDEKKVINWIEKNDMGQIVK